MSISVQKGFWQDKFLADTRQKLTTLYYQKPEVFEKEKQVMLEYWKQYEDLNEVLGDKLANFTAWFLKAASPETITRSLRALKEDGTITLSPDKKQQRQEQEQTWRSYWGNEARTREEQ